MTPEQETQVSKIFSEFGVPERLWRSIMLTESGGNPQALNPRGELSKGLFQINLFAHPDLAQYDLFNPVVNAQIAARRFIAPALQQAQQITDDPRRQAEIVYSGLVNPDDRRGGWLRGGVGIRPRWTDATRERFLGHYDQLAGLPQLEGDLQPMEEGFPNIENEPLQTLAFSQQLAVGVGVLLLVVVVIVAAFMLFKGQPTMILKGDK